MDNGYPRYKVQGIQKKHHTKDQPRNEDIKTQCYHILLDFTSYGTVWNALKTPTPPGVLYVVYVLHSVLIPAKS